MYYNPTLERSDLIERLKEFDEETYQNLASNQIYDEKMYVVIAGSSSLILNRIHIQKTEDIDILELSHLIDSETLEKYDMNTRVQAVEHSLPYYCLDRTVPLDLDTSVIEYRLLTIEDAVCGKIAAYRQKDINHLKADNLLDLIDWTKLHDYALEMEFSSLSDNSYQWFVARFNRFVKENGHEEAIIENVLPVSPPKPVEDEYPGY